MATYNNNLRIKEIATGAEAGSWGTSTNTNLSLIGDALGYATEATFDTDANKTVTVGDATASPYRSMYVKVTSTATLSTTRTLTIGPNTIKRVMFIENATLGNQYINVSQGSGANASIPNGAVMCVYLDGAGAGAAVASVFHNFVATDFIQIKGNNPSLLVGEGEAEDTRVVFNGNAVNAYIGLDDSADELLIGTGSSVGSGKRIGITSTQVDIQDSSSNQVLIKASDNNGVAIRSEDAIQLLVEHISGSPAVIAFTTDEITKTAKIEASLSHGIRFYTNNTARFKVKHDGDLDVTNDLRFETNGKGVILTSPNGTKYRISVDNSGNLSTASV
jgi:hypothetical protein